MKNFKTAFYLVAALTGCLVLSCQKESYNPLETESEVSFSILSSNLKSTTRLKSTEVYSLSEADKIILTIQKADGSPTSYTSSEVKVQQMNGIYYTQKIVLKTGEYKLTEFALKNESDSTIFITPLAGSPEAQNVTGSLPIPFSVNKNLNEYVDVEVLSTEKKTPEDFGYNRFPISEVKTFEFLIGVSDSKSDRMFFSKLTVSNGSYIFTANLDTIINNVVSIKDGLSNYTLKIEKSGYTSYNHTYPVDSLKMFMNEPGNLPLMIELMKEETVTDYDGNIYRTVAIGNQVWMAENLKSLHYADGTPISGVYAYNNNENNVSIYGRLYTWAAAMRGEAGSNSVPSGVQGVAPEGWHIPSFEEINILINFLGGSEVAAGKIKESGTQHWTSPNTGATNESGLTALPGGRLDGNGGGFLNLGMRSEWWTTTFQEPANAGVLFCYNNSAATQLMLEGWNLNCAYSVRCIKD